MVGFRFSEKALGWFSSPSPGLRLGKGIDLTPRLLGDASFLLLRLWHKLRLDGEVMDRAARLWALQLKEGATERIHHLNLKQTEKNRERTAGKHLQENICNERLTSNRQRLTGTRLRCI